MVYKKVRQLKGCPGCIEERSAASVTQRTAVTVLRGEVIERHRMQKVYRLANCCIATHLMSINLSNGISRARQLKGCIPGKYTWKNDNFLKANIDMPDPKLHLDSLACLELRESGGFIEAGQLPDVTSRLCLKIATYAATVAAEFAVDLIAFHVPGFANALLL